MGVGGRSPRRHIGSSDNRPCHRSISTRRGGFLPLKVPHVAYVDRKFDAPSGKMEFYSSEAGKLGLQPLPVHKFDKGSAYTLTLTLEEHSRTFIRSTMRDKPCHRWQNTTLHLSFGSRGSTLKRDSCPAVMGSRSSMSGESSGQRPTSPTTCRQVWSGFAMDGSASINSHLAMRF